MKDTKYTKQTLRQKRVFSEEVKKSVVRSIETGKCTVTQASSEVDVATQTIYQWLYKYSRYLKKNKILVVEEKSESYRSKELERRLKDLEAALGRKQMEVDFLSKLIEIAEKETGIDIKKNSKTLPLDGTGKTKIESTDTK